MPEDLFADLGAEFSKVNWDEPHSDLVKQLAGVYSSDNSGAWAKYYDQLHSQTLFHEAASKYKGFSGPVGSGKSRALCREALRLCFANPGCDGLIGAPTYRMLADVTRREFRRESRRAGIKHEFRAGDNLIYIPECKSTIFFRSLNDPERLVGTNLAWFGVDELTYCKQNSWERLEARLREPKAKRLCGFAVWTPKGFDWVYNRFKNEEKKLPDHECIFAQPGENINLPADFYEGLKRSYDPRFYQQEVLGIYLNIFVGQAYYAFDRKRNVQAVSFDPNLPVAWTMDFNVGQMSSLIIQHMPNPGASPKDVRVLDEIILLNSNTAATCDEFDERLDRLTNGTPLEAEVVQVHIYGDAAGEARSSKADKTDYELIRQWARRNAHRVQLTFHVQAANPGVRGRIASVNAMLCNELGEVRTLIDPRCAHLIEDLEQVGWALDHNKNYTGELDKSNAALTHVSDALGYYICKTAGLKQRGGPVAKTNLRY